jgi:hypothetical protein
MTSGASSEFVKILKDKISDSKIQEEFRKNILAESVDYLISIFKGRKDIEVGALSNFESRNYCFFLDVASPSDDLFDSLNKCFTSNKIPHKCLSLPGSKFVFYIDLEKRLVSSGNSHNVFFADVYSKKGSVYKLRISILDSDIKSHLFDKNYYNFSFWVFDNNEFDSYEMSLKGINRDRKKQKIETPDGLYSLSLNINEDGELSFFELFRKKGKKNKQ